MINNDFFGRFSGHIVAGEVNKEIKKEVGSSVLIKTITYYENTK